MEITVYYSISMTYTVHLQRQFLTTCLYDEAKVTESSP